MKTKISNNSKARILILSLVTLSILSFISASAIINKAGSSPGSISGSPRICDVVFVNEEILVNPTETSIQLKMKSSEAAKVYVEYWPVDRSFKKRSPIQSSNGPEHFTFNLDEGLEPGKKYNYVVNCERPNVKGFGKREVHSFRTLREPSDDHFSFAFSTDSHILGNWLPAICKPEKDTSRIRMGIFNLSMQNMLSYPEIDFMFIGGDHAITHVSDTAPMNGCDEYDEYGDNTVVNQRQATARWERILGPDLHGATTKEFPLFYWLGNHEGETHFMNGTGPEPQHGYYHNTLNVSRTARLEHLPDPTLVYNGSSNQEMYYTFTSGPVRFIVLDLIIGPKDGFPKINEWTLGEEQKKWFKSVLENSNESWKIVMIEHLAGGHGCSDNKGNNCTEDDYDYGRGSIRETDNGFANGTFKGEQAELHQLMKENGGNIVLSGHDHIVAAGEKEDVNGTGEGIYYITGGRSTARDQYSGGSGWINRNWFRKTYDFNNDGVPEYDTNVTGTKIPGFFKVDVIGTERMDFYWIGSYLLEPQKNNKPVLNFTIFADGTSTLPY